MTVGLNMLSREAVAHLRAFKRDVEDALPGRIARVTLYGSRARGDAGADSDYDVAVFVRGAANRPDVHSLVVEAAYAHMLEGIYISPVVLPASYVEDAAQTELAWEIERDGIVL